MRALIALALTAAVARGQATPNVSPDARVYRDIDGLAALGLIDTVITGTRPYSRREVARALGEARRNLDRNPRAREWAESVIALDLERFAPEGNRAIDAAGAELAWLDSPYRIAPSDASGSLNAFINPLAAYRQGRPLADGETVNLETLHTATLGRYVAVAVNPRFTTMVERGGETTPTLRLQSGNVNALFGNLSVEVGRDYLEFGQAPTGGLLLSQNAPPLDMVRLANDRPATLPWLFRYAGPVKLSVFVADLGAHAQVFPHSQLIGYHLSLLPHPRFELGAEVIDERGGRGGPASSLGNTLVDAFPLIDALFRHSTQQVSNKFAGVDFRFRAPELAGLEVYGEGALDDFDLRRFRSSLLEDGGYIAGVSLSCLLRCGALGVRAEYHQTGIRYYTHDTFRSGIEENNVILGDPLGPRGLGAYVTLDHETARRGRLAVTGAYEVRSGNRYGAATTTPNDADFHFVQVEHRPGEHRARLLLAWTDDRSAHLSTIIAAGVEHVSDYAFVQGASPTNALARAGIEVWP